MSLEGLDEGQDRPSQDHGDVILNRMGDGFHFRPLLLGLLGSQVGIDVFQLLLGRFLAGLPLSLVLKEVPLEGIDVGQGLFVGLPKRRLRVDIDVRAERGLDGLIKVVPGLGISPGLVSIQARVIKVLHRVDHFLDLGSGRFRAPGVFPVDRRGCGLPRRCRRSGGRGRLGASLSRNRAGGNASASEGGQKQNTNRRGSSR